MKTRITKPGDTLFLPEGVYHLVESSGLSGTIMVTSVTDKQLLEKFKYLWPKWFRSH
jgi:hypothetical protein